MMGRLVRIAVDGRELERGNTGIARFLLNLFDATRLSGAPLRYQVLTRVPVPQLAHYAEVARRVPLQVRHPRVLEDWMSFANVERRAQNRDVWDAFLSPYYKLPPRLARPSVCVVHDVIPLEWGARRYRGYFRRRLQHALARASQVVTVSEHSRDQIVRQFGVAPERIHVVRLPSAAHFEPRPRARDAALLRRRGVSDSAYLLYVGGTAPHKNLSGLLAGYAQLPEPLRRRHPLVMCVARRSVSRWLDQYRLGEEVVTLGSVSDLDLAGLYRRAGLVVFPSFDEGFGLPPLEAMASGAPVAVSRRGALPEVVGAAGWYFDPADPASLALALREALNDPAARRRAVRDGLVQAGRFRLPTAFEPLLDLLLELGSNASQGRVESTLPEVQA